MDFGAQVSGGRDISRAESVALTDISVGIGRDNGVAAVDREGFAWIMHYRVVVVRADIVTIGDMLIEVVLVSGNNLIPDDGNKAVPILAAVLMP
jgi:hypothetical protein